MKKIFCLSFIFILIVCSVFAGGKKDSTAGNSAGSAVSSAGDSARVTGSAAVTGAGTGTGTESGPSAAGTGAGAESTSGRVAGSSAGSRIQYPPNSIVIYTSMYENVIETVKTELAREFPDYNIVFVYGGTGEIQAKIEGERGAQRLGCDILMVADPSYSIEMKANGMLHPFRSREAANLAFDYDSEGYWYPVRVSNMVLAFNPAINARNTVPASFLAFANSESVRGAVSMSNPLTSGTSTAAVSALVDRYGYDYYTLLNRQRLAIDSAAAAIQKLESGEYKVIMVLEENILRKREEENSRLEVIYPSDGTIMIPSPIMIINDRWSANGNAAACEAVANWFLGPAGQNAIVSGWMHSVRSNFNRVPFDARPTSQIRSNSLRVNWDFIFRQRDMLHIRFEEQVMQR